MLNVIELCQRLIQFPSVTPEDAGIMAFLESILNPLGFKCYRLPFSDSSGQTIHNLYARKGTQGPNLCFAGHVDVVPVGAATSWNYPPFGATIDNDILWGRGAVDMKGAIAAFITAASETGATDGSISLLITGDEEGPATHGTIQVIDWLKSRKETIDLCIVGEPTSDRVFGDTIKIGRRGSLTGKLSVKGVQGHVAYPDKADNPVPKMLSLLTELDRWVLDEGFEHFQPSNLEITSVDVGNAISNIIPEQIDAQFNIRFNPTYSGNSLESAIREKLNHQNIPYDLITHCSAEPFLTAHHPAMDILFNIIHEHVGTAPAISTSGGTSDARFISKIAPVVEFGLLNSTAHKVDEHVHLNDLHNLAAIYKSFIGAYFQIA